jgi:hypothetical protein
MMKSNIQRSMRGWIFLMVFMGIMSIICSLGMSSVNKISKQPTVKVYPKQIVEIIKF